MESPIGMQGDFIVRMGRKDKDREFIDQVSHAGIYGGYGDLKRNVIRQYFLYLNQAGGVIVLDSLSRNSAYLYISAYAFG